MDEGQIALEYLVISAFLLLATGIIFGYSIITLDENLKFAKADKSLAKLTEAAEQVSARGPNNAVIAVIDLPNEIVSNQIIISKNTLSLKIPTPFGPNERYSLSKADLNTTALSIAGGIHTIKIEMIDSNVVFSEV